MSEAQPAILSQDELEALLAEASVQASQAAEVHAPANPLVLRGLRAFGLAQGRALSTLHQRPMDFRLSGVQEMSANGFAETLLSTDRPLLVDWIDRNEAGAIVVGRTLLFGWLTMAFGARAEQPPGALPDRAPTAIELRFLTRIGRELAGRLGRTIAGDTPVALEVRGDVEASEVANALAPRLQVASFEAVGFGQIATLRVALPAEALRARFGTPPDAPERRPVRGSGDATLEGQVLEMPVELRAEIGSADLTLGELGALRPGEVLPLAPAPGGDVVLCIEGAPKYRGVRGTVGSRLAVQIMEPV